jgi:hypothetical protein
MHDQSARIQHVQEYTEDRFIHIYTCLLYAAWANVDGSMQSLKKYINQICIVRKSENIALVLNR